MGNYASKDASENTKVKSILDLSRRLTPDEYMKHQNGIYVEGCLQVIPTDVLYYDSITLYEEINLSFNFISYIPDDFSLRVPHLRYLDISHNKLTQFPNSIYYLLHLRFLNISYNKFETFPEPLTYLPKLITLDVSHNKIKELPNSFGNLKKLTGFNVSHNQLRKLPESLLNCEKLDLIVTLGNNLIFPPQAVCNQGSKATIEFLKRNQILQSDQKPVVSSDPPIFTRVRGQQVMASVSNPESASREYKQAQGTSRSNKRKCPLMLPESATHLMPDVLKDTVLGLVYGACIGDAIALNVEGLSSEECHFYYAKENLSLNSRIPDYLRSFFPPNDWSSNVDIMLLTLESLMRWGGVVDELELVSLIMQWKVHGIVEIDPFPGHLLSTLMMQVIEIPSFSVNPHSVAESIAQKLKAEHKRGNGFHVDINDNSCLPASLVLGIPNFYMEDEVAMNAERICKATHASPLANASCIFSALLISSLLQGRVDKTSLSRFVSEDLKDKVSSLIVDQEAKDSFISAFDIDASAKDQPIVPSTDVRTSLKYLLEVLQNFEKGFEENLLNVIFNGENGICANGCFIGGILGASYGYSNLPKKWLKQLPEENRKWLNLKLNHLLDLFGLP